MAKVTTTHIKGNKEDAQNPQNVSFVDWIEGVGIWAEKNAMPLVVAFVAIVVLGVGVMGYNIYFESKQEEHFSKAYAIEKLFETPQNTAAEMAEAPAKEELTPEKIDEVQPKVVDFIKVYPKSDAARNLAIKWVSKLYDKQEYAKALEVMQPLQPSSHSLSGLAVLLKGSTLLQSGQASEAIGIFKEILKNKSWEYVHPEASFQMSLAQIENKNIDEAITNLRSIQENYRDNREAVTEATKIMRWLQYQKAQGQ